VIAGGATCVWFARVRAGGLIGRRHRAAGTELEVIMPTVTILQGPRSIELKRQLVSRITDSFVDTLGVPADSVQVWIQETAPESWGQGGSLTADK
jgi:4-oxalocrotonate tautomerase